MIVNLTDHSIERYIARVKPHLDRDQARSEIERLLDGAKPLDISKYPYLRGDREYLELSEGIFLAMAEGAGSSYTALTLLTRSSYDDQHRQRKNRRNQTDRWRKGRPGRPEHKVYNRRDQG